MSPVPRPSFTALLPSVLSREHTIVTEGGLETQLIFLKALELPNFCAFEAVLCESWRPVLKDVLTEYVHLIREVSPEKVTMMFDTPTWRASADHMKAVGRSGSADDVAQVNTAAVQFIRDLREQVEEELGVSFLIGGQIGPRGDGYKVGEMMTPEEAEEYHFTQIHTLAKAGVDVVNAMTLNYTDEAVGICRAAARAAVPVVVSFTLETDGCLEDGTSLREAVDRTVAALDSASTPLPAYFMVNCAHTTHAKPAIQQQASAGSGVPCGRVVGFRANASSKSHSELDEATALDDGDPVEFGKDMVALARGSGLAVLGGCCGTDTRHIKELVMQLASPCKKAGGGL
eukprot:CAMPEP_0117664842 /NCGR_PEP_ID=MMETSP0804-20121206/9459_1 /TAXON_ID=1074897 /ORGANISM="Tetraselmis astigmatica, Strain CCMP880" /LENGTH=343 /DNA_ID=CAMNT_0005472149 /DNA_START=241 /DNA_END=1273 /DNA_ORIENTATION=-